MLLINKSKTYQHVTKMHNDAKGNVKTITTNQWNRNSLKFSFKLSKSVKDWSFIKVQVKSLKNIQKKLNRLIEWDYFHFCSKEANVVRDVEKFFKNLRKLLNLRIKGVTRLFLLLFKPFTKKVFHEINLASTKMGVSENAAAVWPRPL